MNIPIVDALGQVVGWTDEPPRIRKGRVRHRCAAALLHSELASQYVELEDPNSAARAGAPPGWHGAWRCMAICPADSMVSRPYPAPFSPFVYR